MKHGANIYKYAKKCNCSIDEIVDFSSNINLYEPQENITIATETIHRYADSNYSSLKEVIAKNYDIQSDEIALYNGATAAIYALIKSLKRKDVFLYAPLFGEYERACREAKKHIYKINRITDEESEPTEDSVVIFVNPSTPEGAYSDLSTLFEMWVQKECVIIIDESFLEFEALPSIRKKIKEYKKLYIIQSFSKFYSCGGVRVGAIFANKKSIKKLSQPLWNLSSFDVAFLEQRLSDSAFKERSRALHQIQKQSLWKILEGSKLFEEIVESDANFILTYSSQGEALFKHLLKDKILVRKCGSFDYLSNNWLRFALKDKEANSRLNVSLETFIKNNNI